jgi:hypothetical protein
VSPEAAAALAACGAIVGVGVVISSLEMLLSWRDYTRGGLFDGRLLVERRLLRSVSARALTGWLFTGGAVCALSAVRALCGIALLVPGASAQVRAASAATALLTGVVLSFRNRYGTDGADQMANVVLAGVAVGWSVQSSAIVTIAAISFIAAQSCLAYFASGVAKVVSPTWRSGEAVAQIMNTETFGSRRLGSWLMRNRRWSLLLAWTVMLAECSFPAVLIAPRWLTAAILVWAASFHVYCAAAMGFNTFFWSFVAGYPAILHIRALLPGHS